MKIGIIGAGHIGGTVARQLARLGHEVSIANSRGPETLARLAAETTGNYYPRQRDGRIDAIESGTPESRWVEQQLGRPVVKAFNSIYAEHLRDLGRPAGSPGRIALPVAGDDNRPKG